MAQTRRVQGQARIGDRVTYFDMANQDGTVWTVTSTPNQNTDPDWGWTKGYGLTADNGVEDFSDLRQRGWTFAQ